MRAKPARLKSGSIGLAEGPEPVVGVAVARGQAAPRGRRRPADPVPPGTSPAFLPRRPGDRVLGAVPVEAPLVNDRAHVAEAVAVGSPAADFPGTGECALGDFAGWDRL